MKTWNDPTVNTDILPQTASHKPIMKVKFQMEVLQIHSCKSMGLKFEPIFNDPT
jgi:hypothetical protein